MARVSDRIPRAVWPLLVLLLVAVAVLFWLKRRGPDDNLVLGGPLFPVAAESIDGFILTRLEGQYRFDREPSGYWTLSGAVSDYLDQDRVQRFVADLAGARGGRLLPGTEVEDPRYEFNGEEALRLTVLTDTGDRLRLALGTVNPVTEQYYASGAGRPATFSVGPAFRNLVAELPMSLQTTVLLPLASREAVQDVVLDIGNRRFVLQRRSQRWWIRQRGADAPDLGPLCRQYQAVYDDRRRRDEEGLWYEADWIRVDGLIYQLSGTIVDRFPPPAEAGLLRHDWGLDHPYWRVVMQGPGLDPDPRSSTPDQLELALGAATDSKQVPVARRDAVLLVNTSALRLLKACPEVLARVNALPFRMATADSFRLDGTEGPVIWARPTSDGWRSVPPPGYAFGQVTQRTGKEAEELVRSLDRTEILQVLPPVADRRVLADRQRLRLTVWSTDPASGAQRRFQVEFGYLQADRLPAGTELVDYPDDRVPPVGVWSPVGGRLLQIPGHIVTTGLTFRDNYRRD